MAGNLGVGKRLIITNGDWTTSHEIGESTIVIGRDPSCDLFFVNQKLSRRHARVEPGPDGVRLVDLGSRNGMWVNEERVGERWLQPGDAIRLGGLRIGFEEDNPSSEPETVILPAHEPEKTVTLGSGGPTQPVPDQASEAGVDQTVMLAKKSPEPLELPKQDDGSETVMLAKEPAESEESSATIVLTKEPTKSAESDEGSATVVLSGGVKTTNAGEDEVDETRYFAGEAATLAPVADAPLLVPESESLATVVKRRFEKSRQAAAAFMSRAAAEFALLNWETKLVLVLSGVGLIVTSTLAVIVLRTHSVLVGVLAGLPLIVGWAYSAVVLARHLTVRPVAELAQDVKALGRGENRALLSRKVYPELDRLVASINRLAGRTPEPDVEDREETD